MTDSKHKPTRLRLTILIVTGVLILAFVNLQIFGKERIVSNGTTVLLPLAPIDPRSLMQGDYMALRYAMATEVASAARQEDTDDGKIVIELDNRLDDGRARFVGLYDDQPLDDDQHLLKFRKRGGSVRLASDAYFFEEGQWETYTSARFGELRVAADGEAVLVGLRDGDGNRLGKSLLPY